MALKIELKPGEKFVVNGAVIMAGKTGASLVLKNRATLLRDRDIMQEHEAKTPARRIYFTLMLMYIDPENSAIYRERFRTFFEDFRSITRRKSTLDILKKIEEHEASGNLYMAMKACKSLIAVEDELLKYNAKEKQK